MNLKHVIKRTSSTRKENDASKESNNHSQPIKSQYTGSESVESAKARERTAAMKLKSISARRISNEETSGSSSHTDQSNHLPNVSPKLVVSEVPESAVMNAVSAQNRSAYFTGGRDFYDDGYESSHDSLEDRLNFSDLKLRGREKEIQILHDVYSHVQRKGMNDSTEKPIRNGDNDKEISMVMIRGLSGTGKSTLVKQFIEDLTSKSKVTGGPTKPYFLSGKYDELSGGDPFSAIVEAFSGFAQSLLLDLEDEGENAQSEVLRIRSAIQESLGEEAYVMATMIPSLRNLIIDKDDTASLPESARAGSSENAWNRLKYIFQVFSSAISTSQRPVVMFLDDLQWSDSASLELIQALMTDKDLRYFMFIGSYRSNEVEPDGELMARVNVIDKVQDIQQIELTNLSLNELNNFIADALKLEDDRDRVMPLTDLIHRKTSGNIFFAMQLLEELQRKGILMFSRMTFEWEWNIDSVDNLDDLVSDDVIVAVTSKISSTPELLQKALITMAYTRSTVDFESIQRLLELDGYPIKSEKLEKLLEKAVLEGLLTNKMGSDNYSFAHDRIQQAAHGMIPVGKARDEYRLKMGYNLYKIGSSCDSSVGKDWLLFAAADHLNGTAMQVNAQEEDPLFLVKINLEVGSRAASVAAHETASKFLGLAMGSLLQRVKDPWESEYEIALKVYQGIVNAELSQGHFEIGRGIANRVLDHAKSSEDKLPIQIALAKALGRERKHYESYKLSEKALQALGQFPKGVIRLNFSFMKDLTYVNKYFGKHSDDDVLRLPVITDASLLSTMNLLNAFTYQAYYCKKMVQSMEGALKQLRLTFKHGIFPSSANAMISYCLFNQAIDNKEGVERSMRLAREITAITKSKEAEVLICFLAAYYIKAWNDPHEEVLEIFARGEKTGMEAGDFENACLCRLACCLYEVVSGFPLQEVDIKYVNLMDKADKFKVKSIGCIALEQRVLVQHLLGSVSVDFEELQKFGFTKNDGSENYVILFGCLSRIQLGIYFGNYEFAEKMIDKVSSIWEMDESYSVTNIRLFYGALVYSNLARMNEKNKSKKRSYLKKARRMSDELKRLCKLKGMKGYHRHLIAEAHIQGTDRSGAAASKMYAEAISVALRNGNHRDAALGGQLAAEYFLNMADGTLGSSTLCQARNKLVCEKLTQARDLYLQWGAKGLVGHLENKYDTYLLPTEGLFDEQSTANGSDCVTFNSLAQEDEFGAASAILPRSIIESKPGALKADDVSVLSGMTSWHQPSVFSGTLTGNRVDFSGLQDTGC